MTVLIYLFYKPIMLNKKSKRYIRELSWKKNPFHWQERKSLDLYQYSNEIILQVILINVETGFMNAYHIEINKQIKIWHLCCFFSDIEFFF